MAGAPFEKSVFINCPFDDQFAPLLQAILFCVAYLGFDPRLASERTDSGENRIDKIVELIRGSLYSVHDLSRCQAKEGGEMYRLNMPLELGIDYGCRKFHGNGRESKRILILETERYRFQKAISDLSGCDIEAHGDDYAKAIRKVRNWLVSEAGMSGADGAARIKAAYENFLAWYYERQLQRGFSEEDIKDYPTYELLQAMRDWLQAGRPV